MWVSARSGQIPVAERSHVIAHTCQLLQYNDYVIQLTSQYILVTTICTLLKRYTGLLQLLKLLTLGSPRKTCICSAEAQCCSMDTHLE